MDPTSAFDEGTALADLRRASIPRLVAAAWTSTTAKIGLREIARLRAELAVAQAVLTGVMAKETGRDTTAALSRHTGMSAREAREATKVAEVIAIVSGAEDALASGDVTAAHLAALAPIANTSDAADLLALAAGQSSEDFAKTVQRVRIERAGPSWSEKQHAARSVKFFNDEYGCIGMRAVLPPVAGTALKHQLQQIADDAWRAAHPERASTLGGHDAEPYDRRLADALISLVNGGHAFADQDDCSNRHADTDQDGRSNQDARTDQGANRSRDKDDPEDTERATGAATAHEVAPGSAIASSSSELARRRAAETSAGGPNRPTVVVTINAETLEAEIVGQGPIAFTEAADLAARADLFAAIRTTSGAILKFGRNRRLASPLQRLALVVRDGGCTWAGCTVDYTRCDADHDPPWEQGGTTDLDHLRLMCRCGHHAHLHETGQNIRRSTDGTSEVVTANGGPADAPARPATRSEYDDRNNNNNNNNEAQNAHNNNDDDDHNRSTIWAAEPPPWYDDDGPDELRRLEDWANWERSFEAHETYSQSA